MNAHDAICKAAHDALCKVRTPHASHVWSSPVPFFDYVTDEIEAAVSAAGYSITLTDDGAAAPPADPNGTPAPTGADQAAESATTTAAPSSRHPEDWTEEERGFVEIALSAADAGNAGHWPTVATYLAAEVRLLRAGEGATPAINREALAAAAHKHFCVMPGEPTHEPDEIDYDKADEILEILARIEGAQ